jgi:hypothetical protein
MLVQQMMNFVNTFGAVMPPHRLLAVGRRVWESMGLKNVDEVISTQDIDFVQQQTQQPQQPQGGAPGQVPPNQLVEGGGPLIDQGPAQAPQPEDVQMAVGFPGVPGTGDTIQGG